MVRAIKKILKAESKLSDNKSKSLLAITIKKTSRRVAKLAGGVALVKVGAATEVEMKEKKARVEDALHATRAAVEEGIVAGGGVALIRARAAVEKVKGENDDQNAGIKIIVRALEEPLRAIALNAGDEPSVVLNKVAESNGNNGYNAATGEYGDLVEKGVVDQQKLLDLHYKMLHLLQD